ncbi:hypothetical protein [Pseudomonas sp. TNT3]|uniref:hypothetical protein n=1 Tax=Pseudomonas sp. TNT3 TaxID=2654097 RepID=UPI001391018A|nr:hypothetical protein [Pseudomonas sp. TNT3]KAI2693224.1 hypothetical protein GBC55_006725 [Pseudomonas sp. TNT3]
MNQFIITYTIKRDYSFGSRNDAFIRSLKTLAPNSFWSETASFCALQSGASAREICYLLCKDTGFDCTKDSVVVIDTTNYELVTRGDIQDLTLLEACVGFTNRRTSSDAPPMAYDSAKLLGVIT